MRSKPARESALAALRPRQITSAYTQRGWWGEGGGGGGVTATAEQPGSCVTDGRMALCTGLHHLHDSGLWWTTSAVGHGEIKEERRSGEIKSEKVLKTCDRGKNML